MLRLAFQAVRLPCSKDDPDCLRFLAGNTVLHDGFINVRVSGRTEMTTGDRVRVTFVVDEGQRTGIAAINFTGNNAYGAGTLKGVVRTRETHLLSWLFKDDSYTETGAGDIGLKVTGNKLRQNQAGLGIRLEGTTYLGGMVVKPELTLAATRDSGTYAKAIQSQFIGDLTNSASFTTDVADGSALNGAKLTLGVGMLLNKSTSMSMRYEHTQKRRNGVSGKVFSSNGVELNVRWNF